MTDHFVMLWGDMLRSSINEHDAHVKWAFVVALLLCDREGRFRATPEYFARTANLPLEQVEDALGKLTSPDEMSTSSEEGGRRIVSEGTNLWRVVNYPAYRERSETFQLRRKWREDKRRQRCPTKPV